LEINLKLVRQSFLWWFSPVTESRYKIYLPIFCNSDLR